MKKTMVFENEEAYDNWSDTNYEKEGGWDFNENRVVIIKTTRTIQGRKFNGFSADATIECKNPETAVRRFLKELNQNGFEAKRDYFAEDLSPVHEMEDCGFVAEVEYIDDDRYYVNFMCYQEEAEPVVEETTKATVETEPVQRTSRLNALLVCIFTSLVTGTDEFLASLGVMITNTFEDYDYNEVELTQEQLDYFYKKVELVKRATGYDGIIANGNLTHNDYAIATYEETHRIIVVDNLYIDSCFDGFDFGKSLEETLCHEIAHDKYYNHGRWHSKLTQELYEKVVQLEQEETEQEQEEVKQEEQDVKSTLILALRNIEALSKELSELSKQPYKYEYEERYWKMYDEFEEVTGELDDYNPNIMEEVWKKFDGSTPYELRDLCDYAVSLVSDYGRTKIPA